MSRYAVAFLCSLALTAPATAQLDGKQWGTKQEFDGFQQKYYKDFTNLANGDRAVAKSDLDALDAMARFYVHRLSWSSMPRDQVHAQFDNLLMAPILANAKKNQAFAREFSKYLTQRIRDLIDQDMAENRVIILNAALLLPRAAKLKTDEIGDFLVEVINSKDLHDSVKLFAVQGLRELFPIRVITDQDNLLNEDLLKKKQKDLARVEALHQFITRKWSGLDDAAVRLFLRKEAIASLAQAQGPAVQAFKNSKTAEGPVAYYLMKPLLKGVLHPEPALEEKIEAALGLLQLRLLKAPDAPPPPLGWGVYQSPDYQPAWGLYLAGQAILDCASEYNKDYANFAAGGKDKKQPTLPWKATAERFKQAAEEAAKLNRAGDHAALFTSFADKAAPVLNLMTKYQRLDNEPVANLRAALDAIRPKTGVLFKDVKGSPTITLEE